MLAFIRSMIILNYIRIDHHLHGRFEKMRIALFSAFPQELKYILKNSVQLTKKGTRPYSLFLSRQPACDLLLVQTGMRTANLISSFNHLLDTHRPDIVLSLGFGGALYYRARIGDLVLASRYFLFTPEGIVELPGMFPPQPRWSRTLTTRTIAERLRKRVPIEAGSVVTLGECMAKERVKASLPRDTPFPVCDRETFHLAKLAYRNEIPFFAIRSITDRLHEDIPDDFFDVVHPDGTYGNARALGMLLTRPFLIPASIRLGMNSSVAAKSLARAVKVFTECLAEEPRKRSACALAR